VHLLGFGLHPKVPLGGFIVQQFAILMAIEFLSHPRRA